MTSEKSYSLDQYFLQYPPQKQDYSLKAIENRLDELGGFHKDLKVIHVAGTNGKGSVCAYLTSILNKAHYSVGTYTSPHLLNIKERIQIDRQMLSDDEWWSAVEKYQSYFQGLSYFEVLTFLSFILFKQRNVDFVVLETGMGGRLDATNVCHPLLSVITNVDYDHMGHLGNTLEKIAFEKMGIIKKDAPVVSGLTQEPLQNRLREKAYSLNSPSYLLHKDFQYEFSALKYPHKNQFVFYGEEKKTFEDLNIWNFFLFENLSLVLKCVEVLREEGILISEEALEEGVRDFKWPARMEIIQKKPLILFDVAHNPHAFHCLKKSLLSFFDWDHIYFLLGIVRDKEWSQMIDIIQTLNPIMGVASFESQRSWDVHDIKNVEFKFSSMKEGFDFFKDKLTESDLLCVTGSLYSVSEVKKYV
ncbi:MAG: bifunctional folylpolyglutamate synthase/dihydrofolate synthase [Deltaproteobacteria bacterium]|nr:bifunctional folylpolyglutamate synthase/dihydrofolate synthase [Deltaproteobacteria bacterium]